MQEWILRVLGREGQNTGLDQAEFIHMCALTRESRFNLLVCEAGGGNLIGWGTKTWTQSWSLFNEDKMPVSLACGGGGLKGVERQECWGGFTMCDLHTHSLIIQQEHSEAAPCTKALRNTSGRVAPASLNISVAGLLCRLGKTWSVHDPNRDDVTPEKQGPRGGS